MTRSHLTALGAACLLAGLSRSSPHLVASSDQPNAEERQVRLVKVLADAQKALADRQPAVAIKAFSEAARLAPDNTEVAAGKAKALVMQAVLDLHHKRVQEALVGLKEASKLAPKNTQVVDLLGLVECSLKPSPLVVEEVGYFNRLLQDDTLIGLQFLADKQEQLHRLILRRMIEQDRTEEALKLRDASMKEMRPYTLEFLGPIGENESPRRLPLTYYHRISPMGQIMAAYNTDKSKPLVGVIGLGTATMAAYCRKGQKFTFYDFDPRLVDIVTKKDPQLVKENEKIATDNQKRKEQGQAPLPLKSEYQFTYWNDAREAGADLKILLGDPRATLARQIAENSKVAKENEKRNEGGKAPLPLPHEKYRILVIDAANSDPVPVHRLTYLLTREALQQYLKMLDRDGILAFHISDRHLDNRPVLHNLAEAENLVVYYNSDDREHYVGKCSSTWAVLARKKSSLDRLVTPDTLAKEKATWRFLAGAFTAVPDAGNRFVPFTHAFTHAITCSKAPWKGPGPDPDASRSKDLYDQDLKKYQEQRKRVGVWTDENANVLSVFHSR